MAEKEEKESFGQYMSKQASRAKEQLLEKFGQADKTTDEEYEEQLKIYTNQETNVLKYEKEVKKYYSSFKYHQKRSDNLLATVFDLYYSSGLAKDHIEIIASKTKAISDAQEEFVADIKTTVLDPLAAYMTEFDEINIKIAKRDRKLLDFDSSRHQLENLEGSSKSEEMNIQKVKAQFEQVSEVYNAINAELLEAFPIFYESCADFLPFNQKNLFSKEQKLHVALSKYYGELTLAMDVLKGKAMLQTGSEQPPDNSNLLLNKVGESSKTTIDQNEVTPMEPGEQKTEKGPTFTKNIFGTVMGMFKTVPKDEIPSSTNLEVAQYQVKAISEYSAEKPGELSFETGDIIEVISNEETEELSFGWLMGRKENGQSGLFPILLTKKFN